MDGNAVVGARELRAACLESRRSRTRDAMRADGIDVLIAYGGGLHSFIGMNPAWWLSGFKQMGPHMAVILPLDGDPVLIMTPAWDARRASESSSVEEIVAVDPSDFVHTVNDELARRQLRQKRIAIAGGLQQPRRIADRWGDVLGREPVKAEKMLSDLARVRDEWSLTLTRQAVSIAERGYQLLLETARSGMYEHEIAGGLEASMRAMGAEDNFQLLSASLHNRSVHAPTNRVVAEGDVMLAEITPAVGGEFIQICRSAVFGKATGLQLEKFALLDTALRAGMRAATPGATTKSVVEAINAPIEKAGYGKYTVPPYMRTRGHSMALGSMDPEIAMDSGHVLEEGMVFVMHPNQYIPETGYLMCGEPVIITKEGAKPLTSRMGALDSIA